MLFSPVKTQVVHLLDPEESQNPDQEAAFG